MKFFPYLLLSFLAITACTDEPQPSFETNKDVVLVGEEVQFTNTSSNAESYRWDFGDDLYSDLESPTHTFYEIGIKNISLTAYSKKERKETSTTQSIEVVDACNDTTCLNRGVCVDGFCECPNGFTGPHCSKKRQLRSMYISKFELISFPTIDTSTGLPYDYFSDQSDPDFYFALVSDSSKGITYIGSLLINADPTQTHIINIDLIKPLDLNGSAYRIGLIEWNPSSQGTIIDITDLNNNLAQESYADSIRVKTDLMEVIVYFEYLF